MVLDRKNSPLKQPLISEAKSLLRPTFEKFCKAVEEQKWDEAVAFYDEEAALVETGKKGVHGREAIKQEFLKFSEVAGKVLSEHYEMTTDFITLNAEFELTSEKKGVEKGKALQIWRKKGDSYQLYHEEFSVA
ncbi:hypothetical protein ANCCEY_08369 [Ancylostoma ceylanicum]|uniref:DUF4440 domain-containing protein n=1 Tax=Ancylostoma ceylanicum TaxID=53326 RepID=A0A0D6LMW3_9BILA|nr:hypothetical protein ANCCEY_08369 [Ancylostoma ceylanicum]